MRNTHLTLRLRESQETGEILTVIYHGGHAPGTKRRIIPRRLLNHTVYVKELGASSTIKIYRIDLIELCDDNAPVPWANEAIQTRPPAIKIDPVAYFQEWAFDIHRSLWPALGVTLREYINPEKTKAARSAAKSRGTPEGELRKIAVRYLAHVMPQTKTLAFHEGDIFYSRTTEAPIQIITCREFIEVHRITNNIPARQAFHITETELEVWLHTGVAPTDGRIGQGESYSEALRFSIENTLTSS